MKRLLTKQDRMQTRDFWIPKGSIKVAPKGLDCVFYLYDGTRGPSAMCFTGTRARPNWRFYFGNTAARDRRIQEEIDRAKERCKYKSRKMEPHNFEVGHIFETCWGYDQTNIEFFKVIEKKGKNTLVVRELCQVPFNSGDEAWLTGKSVPSDTFTERSEPITIRAGAGAGVKIEGHHASLWDGKPVSWTAYH